MVEACVYDDGGQRFHKAFDKYPRECEGIAALPAFLFLATAPKPAAGAP